MYASEKIQFRTPNEYSFFSTQYLFSTECGRAEKYLGRIQGGRATDISQMPWMVALGTYSENQTFSIFCSGFIVTKLHVMTSGHCMEHVYVQSDDQVKTSSSVFKSIVNVRIEIM